MKAELTTKIINNEQLIDLEFQRDFAKYRTVDSIIKEVNLCRGRVMEIAKDAGAIVRIGRAVRINSDVFFDYFEDKFKSDS